MKLIRSEAVIMLLKYPNAFALLTLIAMRAKRENDHNIDGLKIGEAMIGDYKTCGLTPSTYRTAKEQLVNHNLIAIKTTNKGTIATILNSVIYDINIEEDHEQDRNQIANKSQTNRNPDRKQIATNKNKEIKNKEILPPTPLKGESINSFNPIEIKNQQPLSGAGASDDEIHPLRKWIASSLPNVSKIQTQLTNENCESLIAEYGKKVIQDVLESMENRKNIQKDYTSVNLTVRNWAKRRLQDHPELKLKPKTEYINLFPQADL